MKRKLLLLDVVLLVLTAAAVGQLRQEYLAAKSRERVVLGQRIKPVPSPPLTPMTPAPPVTAANYVEIAQKLLFHRDRNPNVVVDVTPPPPPKPMPPQPALRGVMNLGDGPIAILVEKSGAMNKDYRVGEMIGEFKLTAIRPQEVDLNWDGKLVTRGIEHPSQEEARGAAAPAAERTAAPAAVAQTVPKGPGGDAGNGMRACVPNDSTPAGAVVDGFRKVVTPTPFGAACRWEIVK